jgi:hypothetical protein
MGVLHVDLLSESSHSEQADDEGWIEGSAERNFHAVCDNVNDDESIVKADPRIPKIGDSHPTLGYLTAKDIGCKQAGLLVWKVSVKYESAPYQETTNPILQPTQINYFAVTSEEPIDEDVNGIPLCTTAGEAITGITRPISDLGIRLAKNFISFTPSSFYTFIDCVNSDTYLGFSPGVLRVVNISADKQFYNRQEYWAVQVEIHARKPYRVPASQAWYKRFLNAGYRAKFPSGLIGHAIEFDGPIPQPVRKPIQLALDGTPLADQTQGIWLTRPVFSTVAFSSMGF